MTLENLKLEKQNAIAYVTIDRPKVLNALNMATMQELWQVFSELKDDKHVRVVILGHGGTQRLPRLVGAGLAMQILLTGEMITAQEAHRIGLVNEVVPADRLVPRAEEIAQKIIGMAPLAIQYCMEAVNQGMNMTLPEGLFLEATLFGMCCATEDKREGTTAFLEKRAANFQGR